VKASAPISCAVATVLPLLLSGCFLLSTTRKLPVPKPPQTVLTATPEELVNRLNQRWDALSTLTATVDIRPTLLKPQQGMATDYTSFRGHILMKKPQYLRVYVQVPVIGTPALDMVTDGKTFTIYIHVKNKVIEGDNNSTKKSSTNPLENLRPGFFFEALMVRGLEPDNFYMVSSEESTMEDAAKKHLYTMPEYVLSVMQRKAGSQELIPLRVVRFHRDDLLPYQQDIYSADGNLETQVAYGQYANFNGNKYPSQVTIKRPIEGIQLVLTVENVDENVQLPEGTFALKIPPDTPIQKLD
jgi:outer membrane lipoprotein-sorting protein